MLAEFDWKAEIKNAEKAAEKTGIKLADYQFKGASIVQGKYMAKYGLIVIKYVEKYNQSHTLVIEYSPSSRELRKYEYLPDN